MMTTTHAPHAHRAPRSRQQRIGWRVKVVIVALTALAAFAVVLAAHNESPRSVFRIADGRVLRLAKIIRQQVDSTHGLPHLRGLEADMVDYDGNQIVITVTKE